ALEEGSIRRFRCHTGHGFSERALADQSLMKIEETLWSALAQMEEREVLIRELEERADVPQDLAVRYREEVEDLQRMGQQVRELTQEAVFKRLLEEQSVKQLQDARAAGEGEGRTQ